MQSRWNAKADSVSTVILWLGALIAGIVCVAWLAQNLSPDHIVLQQVDNELIDLHHQLSQACNMLTKTRFYNPEMDDGSLIIHGDQVCIDSSSCRVLLFDSNGTEPIFDNGHILLTDAYECGNLLKCQSIYYSSENEPEFTTTNILIRNASLCSNKHNPIRRCRMIACHIDEHANVPFDGLYQMNITKYRNGTYAFPYERD